MQSINGESMKHTWWSDTSTTGKLFLLFMMVEAAAVIGVTILKMIYHETDTALRYGALLLVMTVFLFYFGFHAVKNENKFELWGFVAVSIIIFAYSLYRFLNPATDRTYVLWAGFIVTTVLEPTNLVLAIFVYKSFGWRAFRKLGTDKDLLTMYQSYQIFSSLLKLDLFLGVIGVVMVGMFVIHGTELYIDIGALIITFLWVILGWYGVRYERLWFMVIFFVLCPLEPIYIVIRITFLFFLSMDFSNPFFPPLMTFALLALVNRVVLVIWAALVTRHFGRGLREKAFVHSPAPGTGSENGPLLEANVTTEV